MAVLPLPSDITSKGMDQQSLYTLLANLVTVVNELVDDHETARTELIAIGTTLADFKAIYDAHCHTADGNASRTSVPDSGSPTGSPSAASAFTDTSGSSVPATLTNATDLTLLKG